MQCPSCRRSFQPDLMANFMPFCCVRCKMADLHRWIEEDVGLPVAPTIDDEEDDSQPPYSPSTREWNFE
jgi:endogenous inhibitor of DNA gyrase (YacG/DUF329 family)